MDSEQAGGFPSVNLMPDVNRVRAGHAPLVRGRFWLGLALATVVLISVMAWQLVPLLFGRP